MSEYDAELQAAADAAARSRKSDKRWKQRLTILSLLLAVVTAVAFWLAVGNAELARENAAFGVQQQDEKKEIAKEAGKALCGEGDREIYDRELCEKWANAAQEPTIPAEAPPVIGGPSQAELVNAFRAYCADGNCKGQDGRPPTPDDIAAAFARFCSDGRCVGPAGKDAINGRDGKDAQPLPPSREMVLAAVIDYCSTGACVGASGPSGPPPTAEAIFAAVQQFCADDACRGRDGAPGTNGTNGADGKAPEVIKVRDPAGRTQTCTPDPPGSTTYSCTYDDAPPIKVIP